MSEIDRVERMLEHARAKHLALSNEVSSLEKSLGPTAFKLVDAKRKKLRAKDDIAQLEIRLAKLKQDSNAPECVEEQLQMPLQMASG